MNSHITRRTFLNALGLAGGSSLVFGTMDAWGMMGETATRRREWQRGPRAARVLVLGAGVTGLSTAYELRKLGYTVEVVEARGRVGGVNHTIRRGTTEVETSGERQVCDFGEGNYLNGATWRIPRAHDLVIDYCRELGVQLEVFINDNDDAPAYYEGPEYGALSGVRMKIGDVKTDMRGHTVELLAKAVDQSALDLPLTREDRDRFIAYLVAEGAVTPQTAYAAGGMRIPVGRPGGPNGNGGGSAPQRTPIDLVTILRSGLAGRGSGRGFGGFGPLMFQPVGGMDQIPVAFARSLGGIITLDTEVESIRQNESGVTVRLKNTRTGERSTRTADYLVSCLPLSVLREMDAGLSPEMMAAVKSVPYSNTAKIGLQTRSRFWEDEGIFGGLAATNLPLGSFAYPSHGYYGKNGVLLGFYGSETMGGLAGMKVADRIQAVVDTASKIHPQLKAEFETGYAVFWNKIRYSNGGFATNNRSALPTLQKPDGRIYLGCAATGTSPSWMQGAFTAAHEAVERLHTRVQAG